MRACVLLLLGGCQLMGSTPSTGGNGAYDPHEIRVSQGRVQGHSTVHVFGRNPSVGLSEEVIWSQGGDYPPFDLTAATTFRLRAGGNVNDDAAGSGAREVTCECLDGSFVETSETITTAGASASAATTATCIRWRQCWVSASGTLHGANAGTIIIETTAGDAVAAIQTGLGQTQLGVFTVPAGKTAFVASFAVMAEGTKNADVCLFAMPNADDIVAPFPSPRLVQDLPGVAGPFKFTHDTWERYPERTDLWVTGIAPVSTIDVATEIELVLVED
jgi:hypothetical protein